MQKYPHIIESLYSVDIWCDIFVSYEFFKFFLKCIQLQSSQSMSLNCHLQTKLPNEFLLISNYPYELHIFHPLFYINYLNLGAF